MNIEIKYSEDRKMAGELLAELINLSSVRSNGIFTDSRNLAKARSEACFILARKLLGEDWDCAVLC